MSVGAFYLVEGHTAKLSDVLTPEELSHLDNLVRTRKISPEWVRDVFIPRLVEELNHIDYLTEAEEKRWRDAGWTDPEDLELLTNDFRKEMSARRAQAYQRALSYDFTDRARRELQTLKRELESGELANRWERYLKEEGPTGVVLGVVEGIVTFIPRGIATTARIFTNGGLGERPMKSLAEISIAMPFVIALVRLILGILRQILGILRQIVLPFILSMPKVLWNFILDRVRELGKAARGEE